MTCEALCPTTGARCIVEGTHADHIAAHEGTDYVWANEDFVPPARPGRRNTRTAVHRIAEQIPSTVDRRPAGGEEVHTFDGETYDPEDDGIRLNDQLRRVWSVMRLMEWVTLDEIAHLTGDRAQSVSARLRDFRKDRFGAFEIDRRRRGRPEDGIFEYRLTGRRVLGQETAQEESSESALS